MSFHDIKDGYTEITINGNVYKIVYEFNAIAKLEEAHENVFFSLVNVVDDLRAKPLADIINFCHIGFLRYQPDFSIDILKDYPYFASLFATCMAEFIRCAKLPDEYEQMVEEGKKNETVVKKKKRRSILDIIFFKR